MSTPVKGEGRWSGGVPASRDFAELSGINGDRSMESRRSESRRSKVGLDPPLPDGLAPPPTGLRRDWPASACRADPVRRNVTSRRAEGLLFFNLLRNQRALQSNL